MHFSLFRKKEAQRSCGLFCRLSCMAPFMSLSKIVLIQRESKCKKLFHVIHFEQFANTRPYQHQNRLALACPAPDIKRNQSIFADFPTAPCLGPFERFPIPCPARPFKITGGLGQEAVFPLITAEIRLKTKIPLANLPRFAFKWGVPLTPLPVSLM